VPHRFVVEADGGSRGNPGPAAYGAVVRDAATGQVLAERAEHIGTASNNVAEYRGLIAGLAAVREIDPDGVVEARLDSKLVVEQMTGRWQIKHPAMRELARAARGALPPEQVSYRWVPRAENAAADRLVNLALDAAASGSTLRLDTPAAPSRRTEASDRFEQAELEPPAPRNALVGWADDLGTPTTLLLVRHGETAHTTAKRFSGRGGEDPALTELGHQQASLAAEALVARGGVDALVASPLRRAAQTAEVIAGRLELPVRVEEGFAECDFGAWEGRTLPEVRSQWPAELDAWLDSTAVAPPEGESYDAHAARVALALDKTLARYAGRTVVIVTHVTPVKQLVRTALDAPAHALYRMELRPASFTVLRWWPSGAASLSLFNGTEHLGGAATE
jgi:probable phosphoglycerate mutase